MLRSVMSEKSTWDQLQTALPHRRAIEEAISAMLPKIGPEAVCALLEFLQMNVEAAARKEGCWHEELAAQLMTRSEQANQMLYRGPQKS